MKFLMTQTYVSGQGIQATKTSSGKAALHSSLSPLPQLQTASDNYGVSTSFLL